MSFPFLLFAAYLVLGMGTTTAMWTGMQDELDMTLSMELDDDDDLPAMRLMLSVLFVLVWPMVIWDAFSRRP
ncbi:MAG TPA: hypothetical protein VGF99_05530 [Myxococcota bacterium]